MDLQLRGQWFMTHCKTSQSRLCVVIWNVNHFIVDIYVHDSILRFNASTLWYKADIYTVSQMFIY